MLTSIAAPRALRVLLAVLATAVLAVVVAGPARADGQTVGVWLTTDNLSSALAPSSTAFAADSGTNPLTIDVDDERTYQTVTGFGATFTDSSAWLMRVKQAAAQRNAVMANLFGSTGIGLSMLRQPMGSTDFIHVVGGYYTYDDTAGDTSLRNFSISHDLTDMIPMVQQALSINPNLRVNLTSWSAPAWMKDTGTLMAPCQDCYPGTLLSQYYGVYADYLVKAIQAYQTQGIPIWATSAQNEPTTGNTYNTMEFTPAQSANFIDNYLAPKLYAAGLQPHIFAGDTVDFSTSYAPSVWSDATAIQETEGSSHHGYIGTPADLGSLHDAYPYKPIYQSELAPYCTDEDFRDVLVNGMRNWAQSVMSWNIALDQNSGPYHTGASNICDSSHHPGIPIQPLVTIDSATGAATYRPSYYWTGQFSKFVQPGAKRIATNSFGAGSIENVAFLNPDGTRVVVAWNSGASASRTFKVRSGSQSFTYTLPAKAMATFRWSGDTSNSFHGWGNSVHGVDGSVDDGGFQTGGWTKVSATAATSTTLGAGWHSIYTGADNRFTDYAASVTATATLLGNEVGGDNASAHPKYGIYGCYLDRNNYIQGWVDPTNNAFVTNVHVGGTDYGFYNPVPLPSGFNPHAPHTIGVDRTGSDFTLSIDGTSLVTRSAPISGCQVGLVTEDTKAQFTNLSIQDRRAWGNSRYGTNGGNAFGGGMQAGSWIVNNTNSLESTSTYDTPGSTVPGWNSIYGRSGMTAVNYTVSADLRQVGVGAGDSNPKYGIYACYRDDANYVQVWLDPNARQIVSHALVSGSDLGWHADSLPAGFDPTANHHVSATKSGSSFTFSLDGMSKPLSAATASISGCQIGAVTEDAAANLRNITVT